MEIVKTSFGGVLVKTNHGSFAVNAGGSLEAMEQAYALPQALILTTEHIHRSRNAAEYSVKHGIPLLGSFLAFAGKKIQIPERWDIFLPRTVTIGSISLRMFPVKYDSIDAFALTISDGTTSAGIIPDGKLTEKWQDAIQQLAACDQIYFGNVRSHFLEFPEALRIRYTGNYNTREEIDALFLGYKGKRFYSNEQKEKIHE